MQAQKRLQDWVKELARRTHGQTGDTRLVFGRQLTFMHNASQMAQFPMGDAIQMQDMVSGSSTFGMFYSCVDIDVVDGGVIR
jgi:hypothetical protein